MVVVVVDFQQNKTSSVLVCEIIVCILTANKSLAHSLHHHFRGVIVSGGGVGLKSTIDLLVAAFNDTHSNITL